MIAELARFLEITRRRHWPPQRIRALQERRLHALVAQCYEHVPLYRRRLDAAGIRPDAIRTLEDLQKIPITRKPDYFPIEDALDHRPDQITHRIERTSGSSGNRMCIPVSREQHILRGAVFFRGRLDVGAGMFDRSLTVGHLDVPFRPRLQALCNPRVRLNSHCTLEDGLATFRSFRPHNLAGLPTQIQLFADRVREAGATDVRPRRVLLGGETLSSPARAYIEETFHAPVRMFYGSWEFGFVACECREGKGYHLISDHILVECLQDGEPVAAGEPGEIVMTALVPNVMPFLRYGIRDIGVLIPRAECACRLPGPVIASIRGRENDLLTLADGRRVGPFFPSDATKNLTQVRSCRLIQETLTHFRLEYAADSELSEQVLQSIRKWYADNMLAERIEIFRVQEIPPDPSGKLRRVVSHVNQPAGQSGDAGDREKTEGAE